MARNIHQRYIVRVDHPEGDYYATEPGAAHDIMRLEPQIRHIWEPACGEGHLAKEFLRMGKLAHATDIVDRGWARQEGTIDFLRYEGPWQPFPGDIVTNPPYDLSLEFVIKAIDVVEHGQYVAMLLPITFTETQQRYNAIWKTKKPVRIWVYAKRCNCAKNGDFERYKSNSMRSYAWYVWHKGEYDRTELKWITPNQNFSYQATLL
jgi:hypothetical protein